MVFGGFWRVLLFFGGFWRVLVGFRGFSRFLEVFEGFQWFSKVFGILKAYRGFLKNSAVSIRFRVLPRTFPPPRFKRIVKFLAQFLFIQLFKLSRLPLSSSRSVVCVVYVPLQAAVYYNYRTRVYMQEGQLSTVFYEAFKSWVK